MDDIVDGRPMLKAEASLRAAQTSRCIRKARQIIASITSGGYADGIHEPGGTTE